MNKEILMRYLENRVSEEEKEMVERWMGEAENKREVLEFIESSYLLEKGSIPVAPFDSSLFEKIRTKNISRAKVIALYKDKRFWIACAACIVFLIIGSWMGYAFKSNADMSGSWITNVTRGNEEQYAKLTMSDGSDVYLGKNSKISFPRDVSVHPVVYLEGEAYFDLQNDNKVLTIKTKDLVTRTRGAKLNISAFSKDSTVVVTVEKGNVEVQKNNEVFPLMKLRLPGNDSVAQVKNTNKPKTIPWTKITPSVMVKQNEQATYDKNAKTTDVITLRPGTMPLLKLIPAGTLRGNESPSHLNNEKQVDSILK
ncbi:MAG: FecR family protein [Ginsengibacter sp.]